MKTYLECVPCLLRQAVDVLERCRLPPEDRSRCLKSVLAALSEADFSASPPAMAARIHGLLQRHTGVPDPYRAAKARMNWFALNLLPRLRREVRNADKPFEAAVRLAIAGNIIDIGAADHLRPGSVGEALRGALESPVVGDPQALAEAVEEEESILYLADNAGEIVFDQLLLERLPAEKVTVAVRGHAVLNDATLADACATGLTRQWRVIDNGSGVPGTDLSSCSKPFRRAFREAGLVVAKGQGNYETLSDAPKRIVHLLRVKCPVIARDLGCDVGSMVVRESRGNGDEGPPFNQAAALHTGEESIDLAEAKGRNLDVTQESAPPGCSGHPRGLKRATPRKLRQGWRSYGVSQEADPPGDPNTPG